MKHIHSSIHDYVIHFENDFSFVEALLNEPSAVFIIDQKLYELYPYLFASVHGKDHVILLEAIEENKTLAASEKIFDRIIALAPTKKTKIISFGGGITQDVSGFVASTFYRGLQWIYVPTTLLAQCDSCMGSKTSLNYKAYKNILGTFYPPHKIHICTTFTQTLVEEDFYSGMGEVVKLHAMGGEDALNRLIAKIPDIHRRDTSVILSATKDSLDIKWIYMDGDEFDQGKRNLLNYGHEFGHALETATHYKIPHGQAVIIGMILANMVSLSKGLITVETFKKTEEVFIDLLRCDYKQMAGLDLMSIIGAMKQDKKRIGSGLPLIMMNNNYEFFKILDLTEEEALTTLTGFISHYCK